MTIAAGTKLDRYEIRAPLGAGRNGRSLSCARHGVGAHRRLESPAPSSASDKQRIQRFIREAKTPSALNHPNILTIYEIGHADATRFIATEFIERKTLR
jgi:serine/threonine protein kinase